MSSTLERSYSGTQFGDVSHLMSNSVYGVQKQNFPHASPGEATIMEKMEIVLPGVSARLQELPCPAAGKGAEIPTCLLLYQPTDDAPVDLILSGLNSKLVNAHDKKRVADALQQHLSQKTGTEPKENDTVQQFKPKERKLSEYENVAANIPERGGNNPSNQTLPHYPIAECDGLVEEEARFCSGIEENVDELVQLSDLATKYLRESGDPPPTINRTSSPTQIFSAISLVRRQMKKGMDLLEDFKDLRLQRRSLTEELDERVTRAQNWVRAYDEAVTSQREKAEDQAQDSDRERSPNTSTRREEQDEIDSYSQVSPGDDADEETSSDESFYRGLQDSSASVEDGLE
ncbi:hypothetical protein M407DRAFT_12035 [Tulasnella calospora MUT 4182]|uniref:Uncharacterized protein n=1 Tax=Tulasnella calospora MUT 4182 TaxID=1051891 RepID=A0A0C3L9C5_9AGAM|nr:hypothetical protein M407DRAFT_12035 [Tulasnella calospora MUT 4182]